MKSNFAENKLNIKTTIMQNDFLQREIVVEPGKRYSGFFKNRFGKLTLEQLPFYTGELTGTKSATIIALQIQQKAR